MSKVAFPYQPVAGIDLETSEDQLPQEKVRTSNNCLYERRECFNRPKLADLTLTGGFGYPLWAESVSTPVGVYTLLGEEGNKLVSINVTTGVGTVITGPAKTWNPTTSIAVVNGVVLITSLTGIVRWVPGAGVYTLITTVAPKYITGHISRAVGANTPVANGAINIIWSKPGDETVWTGATNGTGSNFLADADDEIAGLRTIHNTLVIPRRSGAHLAFHTGVAIPAYRFELWSRDDVGLLIPTSLAQHGNVLYMIGTDNVYSFDTASMNPVGFEVRSELLPNAQAVANLGGYYRGFVTMGTLGLRPRAQYHLVPSGDGSLHDFSAYPHYVFDIEARAWSRHSYSRCSYGFRLYKSTLNQSPAIMHDSGMLGIGVILGYWDPSLACEQVATITFPNFVLGEQSDDDFLNRLLLRLRDYSAAGLPTLTLSTTLGRVITSWVLSTTAAGEQNDGKWKRWWADAKTASSQAGNDVVLTLSFPSGTKFSINWLGIAFTKSGDFRG